MFTVRDPQSSLNRPGPTVLRSVVLLLALSLTLASVLALPAAEPMVEHQEKSAFSKIKITKEGNVRTLYFIEESGDAIVESRVDMAKPHDLLVLYTRYMFTSHFFRPQPERVLIVGLGGGSMIHFLKKFDPKCKVDVVEIDPAIIKLADKYFDVRSGGNVNIILKDAFEYLKTTDAKYDAIYMDAFLKPQADTDGSGVPLRLKTIQFYKDVQKKLAPNGLVAFNLHPHEKYKDDLKNMREAFPQTYLFTIAPYRGFVVVCSTDKQRAKLDDLKRGAEDLDKRWKLSYSMRDMVDRLSPEDGK